MAVWERSEVVSAQRGGKTTHHQLWPSPSPRTTRRAKYSPAGRVKSSYSRVGKTVGRSSAVTVCFPPSAAIRALAASSISGRAAERRRSAVSRSRQPSRTAEAVSSTLSRTFSFKAWSASESEFAKTWSLTTFWESWASVRSAQHPQAKLTISPTSRANSHFATRFM